MTKRALLIGINYIGTASQLEGCHNDVYNVASYLTSLGYFPADTKIMTDEEKFKGTEYYPTTSNILKAISTFVSFSKSGDKLFFHYSGHGGSVRDRNRDEIDGKDECIYPLDGMIIDDTLRTVLCDALPVGVTLRCVLDSCHSGSALDLPWRYLPSGRRIQENKKALARDVIMVSGSQDNQYSADSFINNQPSGALTGLLLKILKNKTPGIRWSDFIQVLQYELKVNGYSQIPQLSLANIEMRKQVVDI